MRSWKAQVAINTVKALIPGKQSVRQAWRRFRPYQTEPQKDGNLFNSAIRQIEYLRQAGIDINDKRILEIGSGWHPISAMVFIAAGAAHVTLTDVERLLDPQTVLSAVEYVRQRQAIVSERLGVCQIERLTASRGTLNEILQSLNLSYVVPYSSKETEIGSIDIVVSCSVLEHIRSGALRNMLNDLRLTLAPDGGMIHFVDNSDHYEQLDKSISRLNFLKFEDWIWNLLSLNQQLVQNRLRHSEYLTLFNDVGFNILFEWREVREKELKELESISLATRFRGRPVEDLAAISSIIVAKSNVNQRPLFLNARDIH